MKKTILSLAALALVAGAGAAQAQSSVTVYGLMDAGIDNVNHAAANGNSVTRVTSGGMNTSRWGVRGSEDLGGGLKTVFQLEGGILLDNGTSDGNILFKRQANVGLEGAFGRVIAGRSYTTVYDFVLPFDPMGYAPSYSWATAGNASGTAYGMGTAADNLVKYSGQTGDFKYGASYSFGEQASGTSDKALLSTGLAYNAGPFGLVATYDQANGAADSGSHDRTKVYHLGAMYTNGPLKLQAAMRDYKKVAAKVATAELHGTTYWAGVNYLATPAITLTGAVYYLDVKNLGSAEADPIMYVARLRYALSKRTDLYVAGAYAKAKNGKMVSVSRDDAGFGDTQHGLIAGIQHRF